jgi:hypothetical protein
MTACKYWDCGWCYAPNYLKTNAINSTCVDPNKCPISQPVQYETPMTEIEDVKAQIKVLQSKLSFLEELEKTKSPVEEAFKRLYTYYPDTDPIRKSSTWMHFANGYKSAQEDYKVGEYQEPAKDKVSLYKRFYKEGWSMSADYLCGIVREFLMDEGVIETEDYEYITFTLQKSLLEIPNA